MLSTKRATTAARRHIRAIQTARSRHARAGSVVKINRWARRTARAVQAAVRRFPKLLAAEPTALASLQTVAQQASQQVGLPDPVWTSGGMGCYSLSGLGSLGGLGATYSDGKTSVARREAQHLEDDIEDLNNAKTKTRRNYNINQIKQRLNRLKDRGRYDSYYQLQRNPSAEPETLAWLREAGTRAARAVGWNVPSWAQETPDSNTSRAGVLPDTEAVAPAPSAVYTSRAPGTQTAGGLKVVTGTFFGTPTPPGMTVSEDATKEAAAALSKLKGTTLAPPTTGRRLLASPGRSATGTPAAATPAASVVPAGANDAAIDAALFDQMMQEQAAAEEGLSTGTIVLIAAGALAVLGIGYMALAPSGEK